MSRLELFVLGFLNRKPMHGYEIICFFEKRGIAMWTRVKTPSVYKVLQRLENNEYITGELKQQKNNPPRKVFTITKKGKKYFFEILNSFLWEKDSSRNAMDFWNAFRFIQKNLTRTEFLEIIENRKNNIEKHTLKMKELHQQAVDSGNMPEFPFFGKIMHDTIKEIKTLEISVLDKMKAAAMLPENQKDFKENL
jgi:DNA-binding PadR family transcriptional regulator